VDGPIINILPNQTFLKIDALALAEKIAADFGEYVNVLTCAICNGRWCI
jgi:hypothetical protein